MTSTAGLTELVQELRSTLDAIGDGLIEGLPERLLESESRLAELVALLARVSPDIQTLPDREDLLAARAALRRCETLGRSVRALGDVYATASGGYDRSGHFPAPENAGVLQVRG